MDNVNVYEDALQLCKEALKYPNKKTEKYVYIAMDDLSDGLHYSESLTPDLLVERGIIKHITSLVVDETDSDKKRGFYSVLFDYNAAQKWVNAVIKKKLFEMQHKIDILPTDWHWHDRKKGQYQFGNKGIFHQTGRLRKEVFQHLMDIFEKSPNAISVEALHQRTKQLSKDRIRIEINAINDRLKQQIGFYFDSEGKGFYFFASL